LLLEGNERWATGHEMHPDRDFARRASVAANGQKPFAAILACADSRVPPELLFDEGVGDLFVVRVAGNSIDKFGQQSLEYAADHLGVKTILVLGHQGCGAVKGALDSYPAHAPEFLEVIYAAIRSAKENISARGGNPDDAAVLGKEAIDQHVMLEVRQLRSVPHFSEMIARGQLEIIGGRYDLDTGRVAMLPDASD
jgi:carbonic anhydrase